METSKQEPIKFNLMVRIGPDGYGDFKFDCQPQRGRQTKYLGSDMIGMEFENNGNLYRITSAYEYTHDAWGRPCYAVHATLITEAAVQNA